MSTIVMSACWPLQLPPTPKAVLISLADNANDHGLCWPSISTICMRTCFGKTAVIEAIKWLEEHGLLQADRSNGRHTKYWIKPNGMTPELFDAGGNPSGRRTGTGNVPVRQANQSGKRTGTSGEPDPSASRTAPVREADTNRQEPSLTNERDSARGKTTSAGELAAGVLKVLGATARITSMQPKVIAAAADGVTAAMVLEAHAAYPDKPVSYALTTAHNHLLESKQGTTQSGGRPGARAGPARPRVTDDFSEANYQGTPHAELPGIFTDPEPVDA